MSDKEVILSRIAEVISRYGFFKRTNTEFKACLKCVGLSKYFDEYDIYLTPYSYISGHTHRFKNDNPEYSVFLGLDSVFADLYREGKHEDIVNLLKELTKSFNVEYINDFLKRDFNELASLYELLGLSISLEYDKVVVSTSMQTNAARVTELFSVESWLKRKHKDVYDSYDSAIDSYIQGHAGACIESCRTCIVSMFSEFKGTESFAKWMRGIFHTSGDSADSTAQELNQALTRDLKKDDLAAFFNENKNGKLTKTKTIYMIYSMMSDYGTHRNEATKETPTIEDALFMLRLTDSILFWVYSKTK